MLDKAPTPDRALLSDLENEAMAAWPALRTVEMDGWRLRFAKGNTKRANSANALSPDATIDQRVIEAVETAYRVERQPTIFRLTPLAPSRADSLLAGRGYRAVDSSIVAIAPIGPASAEPNSQAVDGVLVEPRFAGTWIDAFATFSLWSRSTAHSFGQQLARIEQPAAYARVEKGGEVVGFGRAVVGGGRVGFFDILVVPSARKRGLARKIMSALTAWGAGEGATEATLQVVAGNDPALALYRGLGYRECYRYHYRVATASRA